MMRASISALNTSLMLHSGITFETWQARNPAESVSERLRASATHAACMMLSKRAAADARSADERQMIETVRARIAKSPIECK